MKIIMMKKTISSTCLIIFLTLSNVLADPADESFDIPSKSIRKKSNVDTIEKLTYENGQFTAVVNGHLHVAKAKGNVLTTVVKRNQFMEYMNKGNKILLGYGIDNSIEVEATGELLGGGKTTVPVIIYPDGREVIIWVLKSEAGQYLKDNARKGAKYAWKQTKKGGKKIWNGAKWVGHKFGL